MSDPQRTCRVIRPATPNESASQQGTVYRFGISAKTAGSEELCLHVVTVPPGVVARPHQHDTHETALYQLSGRSATLWGETLEHVAVLEAGEMMLIPRGVPHLPVNLDPSQPCSAVIARSDAGDREPTTLRPDLDALAERRTREVLAQLATP